MSKNEAGDDGRITTQVSVTLSPKMKEEIDEEVEASDYNSRSAYLRDRIQAGRKQLARLHPTEGTESSGVGQDILDKIPEKEEVKTKEEIEAPDRDDLLEAVLEPMERQILEEIDALRAADQIENSAVLGGYVKK